MAAMRILTLLSLIALAACQPKTPEPATAPAPIDTSAGPAVSVSDFSQDMNAVGTEPFWGVKVRGTEITLSRPDAADLVTKAPGAAIQSGRATWAATSADGKALKLTLYVSPCSDGMSDLTYPMAAEVELAGETLRGCAAKTAEMPREGGRP